MKFLADMGISPKTVAFLKHFGYEAVHLHEQGLDRLPDPDIIEKALLEGFIILTHEATNLTWDTFDSYGYHIFVDKMFVFEKNFLLKRRLPT